MAGVLMLAMSSWERKIDSNGFFRRREYDASKIQQYKRMLGAKLQRETPGGSDPIRLKINYAKSQLMGVNVEEAWVEKMAYRLYCKRKDLPFKYLGIPIGGNHRRIAMWQNLMELVKKKLAPWKGRYSSFGGRITIVNFVLSSLPVFLMSVYLLPKGILHFIDKIRKSFFVGWGR
ncbi:hypothetical protein SLEP1_g27051 [Rubroshorea leprosula]|uniref:Reverse transcriptase n=1 Tax=Rubroshorea leprosula TaxID=152421 RepID=A0AAV5JP11_9ROSI|nr:hypothetical protein SLEP1_g27051 [Rubroshorea leprosula]